MSNVHDATSVEISVEGPVGRAQRAHAVEHLLGITGRLDLSPSALHLRLEQAAGNQPAHVRITVDLPGTPLTVRADSDTVEGAFAAASAKLHQRLEHTIGRRRSRRRRFAETPGSWHHGDAAARSAPEAGTAVPAEVDAVA